MKWPIISNTIVQNARTTEVEFLQKTMSLTFDGDACKFCSQCIKGCPQNALEDGVFVRKSPTMKIDRLPQFISVDKCVFCGTCVVICPFDAITFKIDHKTVIKAKIPLVQQGVLPKFQELKIGKFVLADDNFQSFYWDRVAGKIVRPVKKSPAGTNI
ncbi:MAG: 4Fe-4S dicluster domain-containing protein [Promethearchaeota archaeon]|nr:MAG: 4Fe-4S dicluster domain-containing protein [Candidatus Lokiarchaeota archaeon]